VVRIEIWLCLKDFLRRLTDRFDAFRGGVLSLLVSHELALRYTARVTRERLAPFDDVAEPLLDRDRL
jgi:hypothetical protein